MHTVELLLDPALESGVRKLWERLHAAGLKSLATHTHPTNRPHVTLAAAASLAGLGGLTLPVPVRLGPARSLGKALVLPVESPELRAMQASVCAALDLEDSWYAPASWVPHVSLALNMPPGQHPPALALLGPESLTGHCLTARSYDTESRSVVTL